MRIRETALIAAREVRDSFRNRWFLLASASFGVLSLALSLVGLAGSERSGLAGFDRTTAGLLNLTLIFIPLVTLSLGGLSIAGELEDGSLSILLAQPVTRSEVFFGKFFGLLASVTAAICTGFGATGLLVGLFAGGGDGIAFLSLIGLSILLAAATLACGTLFSIALRSRARVIGVAFAAWLCLVYLSDLGTIGLVVARHLEPARLFTLALLNPVEQARVLGTLALTARPEVLGPVGLFGMDQFGPHGVVVLLMGDLVLGSILLLAAGWGLFRKAVVP